MSVNSKLTAIADAIRGKTGGTEKLTLADMPLAIAGIEAGGGGGQYETGEMIGDGLSHLWYDSKQNAIHIPVSFEPDILFMCLTDTSATLDANHVYGGCLIRDIICQASYRQANSPTVTNGGFAYWIDGLIGQVNTNRASYENGIVSWWLAPGSRPLYNGASYTWIAGKW